jgi:hypothetical protein
VPAWPERSDRSSKEKYPSAFSPPNAGYGYSKMDLGGEDEGPLRKLCVCILPQSVLARTRWHERDPEHVNRPAEGRHACASMNVVNEKGMHQYTATGDESGY